MHQLKLICCNHPVFVLFYLKSTTQFKYKKKQSLQPQLLYDGFTQFLAGHVRLPVLHLLEPVCPNHNHLRSPPALLRSLYFTSSAVPPGSLVLHLIVLSNVCCPCPRCGVAWLAQERCV